MRDKEKRKRKKIMKNKKEERKNKEERKGTLGTSISRLLFCWSSLLALFFLTVCIAS